jgi:arylsulfatase A-like enzyme
MFRRIDIGAIVMTAIGGLLGYTAAAGKLNFDPWTRADQRAPTTTTDQPVAFAEHSAGCCDGSNIGETFALTAYSQKVAAEAQKSGKKPNFLVIWGDDIGLWNISAWNRGMMKYSTPNIDRIAREGLTFTDYYGQQSCTAARSAFITGQSPFRTGLTKVGVPGSKVGLQPQDPTLAELLKPLGYATGHFGKNHLGDLDEHLPTMHGFDEFYGNLYHLNAEEQPENVDYPKDPAFRKKFGPRGVIRSRANGQGGQTVEDTGPLTIKRMETVDDEFLSVGLKFIDDAHRSGKPFFVWFNTTRMHFRTHVKPATAGLSGQDFYNDAMMEHDAHVGQLLKKLDDLGIANDTIVIYSTDNGPHFNTWPDAGITPFRSEKNTNWEGGFRVPAFVRWPGQIVPGTVSNEILAHEDWLPTLLAAAGEPNIVAKLLTGHRTGDQLFKVHLDGHNALSFLTGKEPRSPRRDFLYFNDDGMLVGLRYEDWKIVFAEQRAHRFDVWREPFVPLRLPLLFNLRRDPFERAETDANAYNEWWVDRTYWVTMSRDVVARFVETFRDFPQRQKPAAFNLDRVLESLNKVSVPK